MESAVTDSLLSLVVRVKNGARAVAVLILAV